MIQRFTGLPKNQSFFLFGPRGCGKSTLLKSIFTKNEVLWIDLLVQKLEFQLSNDPDYLLQLWKADKPKWVVIDEIQKVPALLDVVHRGIEENKIQFALTGSSARKIKKSGANLLAGRAIERKIFPFSSIELDKKFDLKKSLEFGLLPSLWDEKKLNSAEKSDFLYSYVQTYLKEEIAAEQIVRQLDPFRRFLIAAAQSNAKILNYAKIERDAGVPQRQVLRHFEILADTLIGHYLEPFHNSQRKRKTSHSKFYFFDTGVVRALQNRVEESLAVSSYEYGDLFETFLINEFIKIRTAFNLRWNFSYFRGRDDKEIDLIIEKPKGKPILVEIKSAQKFTKDELKSIYQPMKEIEHSHAYLLSNSTEEFEYENLRCLNWQRGLKEIFDI